MDRLNRADVRTLLEFLRSIYALRDLDAYRNHAMSAIRSVVRSELAGWSEMTPAKAYSQTWFSPAYRNQDSSERPWRRHMTEHPTLMHQLTTGSSRAARISDFLTRRQLHDLGLYTEVYRPMGVENHLGIVLSLPRPRVIGIGLHRDARDFSERDRLLLDLLGPHLVQAYRNARAVTRIHFTIDSLTAALETMSHGAIVTTRDARVSLVTSRAEDWLAKYFGQGPRRDRLPPPLERWLRQEQARLEGTDDVPPPRRPLVVERSGEHLVIRLFFEVEHAILVLEEEHVAPPPVSLERFGLTRREAEVLAALVGGMSNADVASVLSTRPRTVAKHLERIYAKLGVENRTAAINRALTPEREAL